MTLEYIGRLDAVNLIAGRTCPKEENLRAWKNKINGRIKTRIKNGEITTDSKGCVRFLDVSLYAQTTYPGKFDDWPAQPAKLVTGSCCFATLHARGSGHGVALPGSLKECYDKIISLSEENKRLMDKVSLLENDNKYLAKSIAKMQPIVERRQAICEKNRNSARKPRKN